MQNQQIASALSIVNSDRFIPHYTPEDLGGTISVMEKTGKCFGRVYWLNSDPGTIYMDDLSVSADTRQKGLGQEMIEMGEKMAKALGGETVALWVRKDYWVRKWYQRIGYQDWKEHEDQENAVWMRKSIAQNTDSKKTKPMNEKNRPLHEVSIKGIILDSQIEQVIPGAEVFQNETDLPETPTDENGIFLLEIDPEGKKSISVSAPGYKTRNFPFHVNGKPHKLFLSPDTKIRNINEKQQKTTQKTPPVKEEIEKIADADNGRKARVIDHPSRKSAKNKTDWGNILMIGLLVVLAIATFYFLYKLLKSSPSQTPAAPGIPTSTPQAAKTAPAAPAPAPSAPNTVFTAAPTPKIVKI